MHQSGVLWEKSKAPTPCLNRVWNLFIDLYLDFKVDPNFFLVDCVSGPHHFDTGVLENQSQKKIQ